MGNSPVSTPVRVLCGGLAVLGGWVAVSVWLDGELRTKGGVIALGLWGRCLVSGVLGLMAVLGGWVAVRGRG